MLNLGICLVCLVKLFVYGEPIVAESEMQEYYVYKKKADQLMDEVCKESFSLNINTEGYARNFENNIFCFSLVGIYRHKAIYSQLVNYISNPK